MKIIFDKNIPVVANHQREIGFIVDKGDFINPLFFHSLLGSIIV
jgi:hypothetical protein